MLVSVIIPCYKGNATIQKTLQSVFRQTMQDFEIILVDVAGTLDKEKIRSFAGAGHTGKLKILHTPKTLSPAFSRNTGVRYASGDYIAYLDADDLWTPDKLSRQMHVMETCRIGGVSPALCFSGRRLMDEKGHIIGHYIGCENVVRRDRLLETNQISCSSVVMKRETALQYPFRAGNFHEDYLCWIDVLSGSPTNYAFGINKPLILYRVRKSSRSANKFKSAIMTDRVYRAAGLSLPERIHSMTTYAVNGLEKFYGKQKG